MRFCHRSTVSGLSLILVIFCGNAIAQSNQGSRPTLDSFDLVTTTRMPSKAVSPVMVDQQMYEVLGPLMDLSRKLENDYRATVIDKKRTVKPAEYLDWLSIKTMALYRSMLIVKELDNVPRGVRQLLTDDQDIALNIARVIGAIRLNARNQVKTELDSLIAQYSVPSSQTRSDGTMVTDLQLLVDAMFRNLNNDLARITPR